MWFTCVLSPPPQQPAELGTLIIPTLRIRELRSWLGTVRPRAMSGALEGDQVLSELLFHHGEGPSSPTSLLLLSSKLYYLLYYFPTSLILQKPRVVRPPPGILPPWPLVSLPLQVCRRMYRNRLTGRQPGSGLGSALSCSQVRQKATT